MSSLSQAAPALPGRALLSPLALGATTLIVVNDLWLKARHAGWWSGKLSDVGLCILLPLFVQAALEWLSWLTCPRAARHCSGWALAIGLGYFSAVKCMPIATHLHQSWVAALTGAQHVGAVTDPSDLIALPFAALAWHEMRKTGEATTR